MAACDQTPTGVALPTLSPTVTKFPNVNTPEVERTVVYSSQTQTATPTSSPIPTATETPRPKTAAEVVQQLSLPAERTYTFESDGVRQMLVDNEYGIVGIFAPDRSGTEVWQYPIQKNLRDRFIESKDTRS